MDAGDKTAVPLLEAAEKRVEEVLNSMLDVERDDDDDDDDDDDEEEEEEEDGSDKGGSSSAAKKGKDKGTAAKAGKQAAGGGGGSSSAAGAGKAGHGKDDDDDDDDDDEEEEEGEGAGDIEATMCAAKIVAGSGSVPWNFSQVDLSAPDLAAFPKFANAVRTTVELDAGECLFLPAGWFHNVTSLPGSAAATAGGSSADKPKKQKKDSPTAGPNANEVTRAGMAALLSQSVMAGQR